MRVAAGVEATFVPGDPPRTGWLALWRADGEAVEAADTEVALVLPAGRRVRRRNVPAARLPIAAALDVLAALPTAEAGASTSLRAWSAATRLALGALARGRLVPGITPDGHDTWRLGPLDPDDTARLAELAAALPPAAHATWVPGSKPLRISSPGALLTAFCDAVADCYPRTAAAPIAAGSPAFAVAPPHDPVLVDAVAPWFATVAAGVTEGAACALRLVPPDGPDSDFVGVLQLQSRRDPSLVVDAADLWSAPDPVLARFGADAEATLLLALRRGARVWSPLRRLLDEAHPDELVLDDDEAEDLLGPAAEDLAAAGVQVLWPAELLEPVTLRPVIATPTPAAVTAAGFSLESLCELHWRATLDGEELTADELAVLAEAKRPMVRLRGRWVRADPERLARLRRRHQVGAGAALAAALGGTLTVDGETVDAEVEGPLAELAARLAALDGSRGRPAPSGLDATLRPYQQRGLDWLAEMAELGLGGVLADDMGLGKTVQFLALHLERRDRRRPTLVVCPASLLGNWEREAARFAPGVPVRRYHGGARTLDDLAPDEIVLATYGVARRDTDALAAVDWGLVAADEAQAVKNPLARTARALRRLPGDARFALTGTPVENRLTELWAILDWTTPGLLGPLERFRREVAVPVERDRDPDATRSLAALVRPFLLRRRKSDPGVAPDLPPKTETDRFVPLTAEQATIYAAVAEETLERVRQADGIDRRGLVLKLLTALKQICNHPAHYLGQADPLAGRSGKLDAATELLEVIAEEGDSALVFTQYVAMGRLLEAHLGRKGLRTAFLHGRVPVRARERLVDEFQAGGVDAFVISLKAGGTGLNLTRATHVVHYDRWWNPAVEDQASDRAWRIGQDRPVQVHRMVCEGTMEERIAQVIAGKRELADAVVGAGEGWISELGDDELADLVRLAAPEGA